MDSTKFRSSPLSESDAGVVQGMADFITLSEWLPYSTDLNPMDYNIWSILEARARSKPHNNLVALKQSLQRGWDRLSAEELRREISEAVVAMY